MVIRSVMQKFWSCLFPLKIFFFVGGGEGGGQNKVAVSKISGSKNKEIKISTEVWDRGDCTDVTNSEDEE